MGQDAPQTRAARGQAEIHSARMVQITWILVGILLLAALLRFHRLDYQSLWVDEQTSRIRSSMSTLRAISEDGTAEDWPPGYFFFLHYVIKLIGDSPFILRFPSALAGIVGVAAIYTLGRRLYDPMTGVAASALTAVLVVPVYFSQEARAYSFIILLTIVSTFFWDRMLARLDREGTLPLWDAVAYAVSAVALAYQHYFGVLFVFLQGAAAGLRLLRKPRRLLTVGGVYLAVAMAYLPQMVALLHSTQSTRSTLAMPPAYPVALLAAVAYLFNSSAGVTVLALSLIVAAGVYAVVVRLKNAPGDAPGGWGNTWLLVGWLLAVPTAMYLRSVLYSPLFVHRYLVLSAPAAYLLLARAITGLPLRGWVRVMGVVGVAVFALGNLIYGVRYYSTPNKEQTREAVGYVMGHKRFSPDDLVIGHTSAEGIDYYFEQLGSAPRVDISAGQAEDIPAVAGLIVERQPPEVWYIAVHSEPDEAFVAYLTEHMTLVEHREWFNAQVWLFEAQGSRVVSGGGCGCGY
jgi:mannosyltransferase